MPAAGNLQSFCTGQVLCSRVLIGCVLIVRKIDPDRIRAFHREPVSRLILKNILIRVVHIIIVRQRADQLVRNGVAERTVGRILILRAMKRFAGGAEFPHFLCQRRHCRLELRRLLS